MNNKILTGMGLILIAILGVFLSSFIHIRPEGTLGAGVGFPYYGKPNNTAALCGQASSTLLIATSTGGRQYIRFSNESPTAVFLGLSSNAATNSGVTIFASSTFEFSQNPIIFMGSVYCTAIGANATITIEELN